MFSEAFRLWTSYQIRKIAGCACARNAGNVFPHHRFQRKSLVSDPGMHHGTCVTHVSWCMSGSLTCGDGKTFPAFPAHAHQQFCVSGKTPVVRYFTFDFALVPGESYAISPAVLWYELFHICHGKLLLTQLVILDWLYCLATFCPCKLYFIIDN